MIRLTIIIILSSTIASANKDDFCTENLQLSDVPGGILGQLISLVVEGYIGKIANCPILSSIQDGDVKFLLYDRLHPDIPIVLDPKNAIQLNPYKPIKILTPGWLCNVTNDRMPQLITAYLQRYDCNVIGIDWSNISIDFYPHAFCNVPQVAGIVGAFLCNIRNKLRVDLGKVHVIGHSMGGHLAGFIGKETQKQCQAKLGRITGLDPAGPLYQNLSPSRRLHESDASFVDVIHSNMGFYGYYGACGSVDFFVNWGTFQKGCVKRGKIPSENIIMLTGYALVGCPHLRAADYMIESINTKNFTARSCSICPGLPIVGPCIPNIFFGSYTMMGEDSPSNPRHRRYMLSTNSESPYSQG